MLFPILGIVLSIGGIYLLCFIRTFLLMKIFEGKSKKCKFRSDTKNSILKNIFRYIQSQKNL